MNAVQVFENAGRSLRVVEIGNEPWFVAADVCQALEIANPSDAMRRLDPDEHTLVSTEGMPGAKNPQILIVSEPGLYSLIQGSRKAEAKAFRRWINHDVLPSIRKTGRYAAPGAAPEIPETPLALRTLAYQMNRLADIRERIAALQEDERRALQNIRATHPWGAPAPDGPRRGISLRTTQSNLAQRILEFARPLDRTSMSEVIAAIGVERNRGVEMLIAELLRAQGFQRSQQTCHGKREWLYVRG